MSAADQRRRRNLLAGLCAGLLAGCTVGPDYQRPTLALENTLADEWHTDDNMPVGRTPLPLTAAAEQLAGWWKWFEDPVLDSLIESALAQNLDVRAAAVRIAAARAERRGTAAGGGPAVGAGLGASRQQNPLPGLAEGLTFSLYELGFDARWELDLFGRVRRRVEAADATVAAAVEDRRWIETILCTEVARAYWDMRHAERALALGEEAQALAARQSQLARRLVKAGLVPRQQALRADAEVAARAADLSAVRIAHGTAQRQIERLLGEVPLQRATLLSAAAPPAREVLPKMLLTPAAVLRQRPDIRQAERQLAAATALKGAALADMYPRVSLAMFFGVRNTAIGMLLNAVSKSWSGGGSAAVPLFDAGRLRAAVDVSDARIEAALVNYERTMLGALHEVEVALLRLLEHERERTARAVALSDLREASTLATRRLDQGVGTRRELLAAEQAVNGAARALETADAAVTTETIAVMKALGAGIPAPATDPPVALLAP